MMNDLELEDKMMLSYPDSFHVMDSEERKSIQFFGDAQGECLSDSERHIMISIGWKSVGIVSALLLNAKDLAKKMESDIRKPMQRYGYRLGDFAAKKVGSKRAEGFCYEYETQGIGMYGESYVVKNGRTFYYLNLYARREDVWNSILSSVKIS